MPKSIAARNRTSRTKGRQGEFMVREMLTRFFDLHPDDVILRSKSANGCDVIFANRELHKFPFSVEVKNRKSIPYFQVVEQMLANTEEKTFPLSIILNERLGHTCIIPVEIFLAMICLLNDTYRKDWIRKVENLIPLVKQDIPKIKDARASFKVGD